jgi:hypothetical protein
MKYFVFKTTLHTTMVVREELFCMRHSEIEGSSSQCDDLIHRPTYPDSAWNWRIVANIFFGTRNTFFFCCKIEIKLNIEIKLFFTALFFTSVTFYSFVPASKPGKGPVFLGRRPVERSPHTRRVLGGGWLCGAEESVHLQRPLGVCMLMHARARTKNHDNPD